MTFQEKVIRLRKLKGLTQDEFASAVGVSRQAVYKWESGKSYPEVAKLLEIKLLFNISIDDLLDESYEVALPEKKKRKRLSRSEKAKVEAEILAVEAPEATPAEAPAAVEEEVAPAPVAAEPVIEQAPAASEPAPAEEPEAAPAEAPAPAEEEAPEEDNPAEDAASKKPGFFARLFGRK